MEVTIKFNIPDNQMVGYNNPYANCPNNPINNPLGGGVCCCALPSMYNPIT